MNSKNVASGDASRPTRPPTPRPSPKTKRAGFPPCVSLSQKQNVPCLLLGPVNAAPVLVACCGQSVAGETWSAKCAIWAFNIQELFRKACLPILCPDGHSRNSECIDSRPSRFS